MGCLSVGFLLSPCTTMLSGSSAMGWYSPHHGGLLPLLSHPWGRSHRYTEVCLSNLLGTSQSTEQTNKMIHPVFLAVSFFISLCFLLLEFVELSVFVHLPFLLFVLKQCLTYSPGQIQNSLCSPG